MRAEKELAAQAAGTCVAELAKAFDEPGHKIRVKDEAGGIVILIGVMALRRCANAVLDWLPPAFAKCAYLAAMSKEQ